LPAPASTTNGVLVIPVSDKFGKPTNPMVLMPVAARPKPTLASVPSNSPPPTVAVRGDRTNVPALPPLTAPAAYDERILAAQVALCRHAISSGPLDGTIGSQTRAALRVFQQKESLPVTGRLDEATLNLLQLSAPLHTNYIVSDDHLASLQPLSKTWLGKSQQSSLAYESLLELVAEKTHSHPKLIGWLNPQIDWAKVTNGTAIKVANADYPVAEKKAAFLRIHLAERKLHAYDAETNLLVHFPCSIAARVDKRPLGEELHISAVAPDPNYTFDPAVFPESAEAQQLGRKLILPPGPNNPVGTVWLSLDKPGYGIHGTPKPEEVGRTESHGCFRLANWNAEYLLKLVTIGTPVFVEP
jgi:lipoprotein-anchoring transpeptidase ErfK/SrfK